MAKSGTQDAPSGKLTLPPDGWTWNVGIGWAADAQSESAHLVTIGTAMVPSRFILNVRPPEPAGVVVRLMGEIVDGKVTIPVVAAEGVDATRGTDILRKALPIGDWMALAIAWMSVQLLMEQARSLGDAGVFERLLKVKGDDAEGIMRALSGNPAGALLDASDADVNSLRADPAWVSTLAGIHSDFTSGGGKIGIGPTPVRGAPRRNSITKEHLQGVAAEYRRAVAAGEPPTKAVALRFDASHSTAARWVKMAREAGELGTTSPGRAGEE